MSSLQKSIMKSKLPPMPSSSRNTNRIEARKRDLASRTPVHWNKYFTNRENVETSSGIFCIYLTPESDPGRPLLVMLHGGGFSALTWSLFSTAVTELIYCQILAIDLRGHGDTSTSNEQDLSAQTLASDVGEVIAEYFKGRAAPPIFLVGHSMGGAVAVHIASKNLIPSLIGLSVIDVVEGTAMEALASMQSFLRSRPAFFKSIEHAIDWSLRSGQIRNIDSAKVSMPGQIINVKTGKLATNELDDYKPAAGVIEPIVNSSCIEEEAEDNAENNHNFKKPMSPQENLEDAKKYGWRIDLARTEEHWPGWFKGMSELFLNIPVPKLLLLASIDGLDRTLTVGQMQGKFQMMVLSRCGHAVHEDKPTEVAEVISSFLLRHRFAEVKNEFTRHMPAC